MIFNSKQFSWILIFNQSRDKRFDSRPRGGGFGPCRHHCAVVLELGTFYPSLVLVQPRNTYPCLTERLLMGRKESNQTNKQTKSRDKILSVVFFGDKYRINLTALRMLHFAKQT